MFVVVASLHGGDATAADWMLDAERQLCVSPLCASQTQAVCVECCTNTFIQLK